MASFHKTALCTGAGDVNGTLGAAIRHPRALIAPMHAFDRHHRNK